MPLDVRFKSQKQCLHEDRKWKCFVYDEHGNRPIWGHIRSVTARDVILFQEVNAKTQTFADYWGLHISTLVHRTSGLNCSTRYSLRDSLQGQNSQGIPWAPLVFVYLQPFTSWPELMPTFSVTFWPRRIQNLWHQEASQWKNAVRGLSPS